MKTEIFYFSGTGNTRKISEEIMKRLDSKENPVEIDPIQKGTKPHPKTQMMGIGYPVYDFLPPKIVLDFLNNLPESPNGCPVFLFSTYSISPLDAHAHSIKILNEKRYFPFCSEGFKSPGPVVYFFTNPENRLMKHNASFGDDTITKLNHFTETIKESTKNGRNKLSPRFHPLNKALQLFSFFSFGMTFYRNLKVKETCTSCGLCVKNCPDNNLILNEGKITIKKNNNCLRCLKCHQVCPQKAIEFTSRKRKGDYPKGKPDELFQQISRFQN